MTCFFALLAIALWSVGQLARDATWATGLCFYIPSPLIATGFMVSAMGCAARKKQRAAIVAALLAIPPFVIAVLVENHWTVVEQKSLEQQPRRIVHWNVAGHLEHGARELLKSCNADLYVLSEISNAGDAEALRRELGADYRASVFSNLAVIGLGDVRAEGWLLDRERKKVQKVTWTLPDRELVLLVVDLPPDLRLHRGPMLREVNALIHGMEPDIIIGDFNAPRRSLAFSELPVGYRHAYDTAGAGWGYTWPVPFPVYSLDHCLHSAFIVPIRYSLKTSLASDHRMQVFDFGAK